MRTFNTGANRNSDHDKLDYEGFLSPLVLKRYAEYMHKHRHLEDGSLRDSDNWQKGIPRDAYMKSGWRHFHDWWLEHRGQPSREGIEDAICGVIFNAMGYLHQVITNPLPPPLTQPLASPHPEQADSIQHTTGATYDGPIT